MQHTVYITDFNNHFVQEKLRKAAALEEINEFSTPEQCGKVIANSVMELVRQQLGMSNINQTNQS
jgi:hypothetical protein